jgi:hypothetical protein
MRGLLASTRRGTSYLSRWSTPSVQRICRSYSWIWYLVFNGPLLCVHGPSSLTLPPNTVSCAATKTPAMMLEESRMPQVSIFQTLEHNLSSVEFHLLLGDAMAIADEVDSQLAQQMAAYISESKKDAKAVEP